MMTVENRPKTVRAVAYCRVSTPGQAAEGVSLEAQEAKLAALAALHEYELVETIRDEGQSARSLRRPGMERVLEMVKRAEIDALLVARLDRLTRSLRDLLALIDVCERKNVRLVSAQESLNTSDAGGRMVVQMLGVVNEWQRRNIVENTIKALDFKRSNGKRTGGVPYGWQADEDGTLGRNTEERNTLALLKRLRRRGLSLAKTAAELTLQGRMQRNGKPWSATQVRRVEDPERARREARRYYGEKAVVL